MNLVTLINFKQNKKIYYFIFLLFFSVSFNQYYGYKGINPIDSFFSFNSGYDVLNGYFPFKDYWTITGPFIDFIQAFFFKIFGVSWFSYVFHASFFNFIITISTFFTLLKFKLNLHLCFLYAFLVAILAYPSSGTPYVDHQSAYLSIIAIYCFILALSTNRKIYWFFLPIIFGTAFLTKQAPSGHIFFIVSLLSIIHFAFNFNIKKIFIIILGSLIFILLFLIILKITKIPFLLFFQQYILFPLSLGESRLDFLFPLEFSRIILRFKLLHLSSFILIIIIITNIIKDFQYIKKDEFLIILALVSSSFALIAHQLMTINGIFIFFIIPILCGFSHIYYLKYIKDKNYIAYLLIFLSISSTLYYGYQYIDKRNFMDLNKANFKNAVDAKILDKKLNGLKWITPLYPNNPENEVKKLQEVINIIKKDSRNKAIVTDYQFISVILSSYDYSPNKYWYTHHVYPSKNEKHFNTYKKFFINKFKENKIQVVYTIKPLWGDDYVLEGILEKSCVKKKSPTDILDIYILFECNDLTN